MSEENIPPNLKEVLMPFCCMNCNHMSPIVAWCKKYDYDTEYSQVCDSWDKIEYGN